MATRRIFDSVPGQYRARPTRNGLIFLGLVGLVFYFMFSGGTIPFWPKGGYTIKADFETAANVSTKTPVRYRGVEVGGVEKVERQDDGDGVTITMRIDKDQDEFELKRDAGAHIYWRTLLGFAFYIELDPGTAREKLDGKIPQSRTSAQVELDQVLASVDRPSREAMQTLFKEFEVGFDRDSGAGETIDRLGPAMRQIGPGLRGLRGIQEGDLTDTVRNASRLMGVLARNEDELGSLISGAETTLGVTAARRAEIASTLQNGPSTLTETTNTMRRIRTTLDELDPVADDLRPGVRVLDEAAAAAKPALRELRPTLDDARPLLRDLQPAVRNLRSASANGVPLLEGFDPGLKDLRDTVIPKLNEKRARTGLTTGQAIGPTLAAVSSATSQGDSYGYTVRFNALAAGDRSLGSIPCRKDLSIQDFELDCTAIFQLLGIIPTPAKAGARNVSGGGSSPGGGAPSSGGGPGSSSAPKLEGVRKQDVDKLADDIRVKVSELI